MAGATDYTDRITSPPCRPYQFAALTRSSPVEDLIAGGFGTLTSQPVEEQTSRALVYGKMASGRSSSAAIWNPPNRMMSLFCLGKPIRWPSPSGMVPIKSATGKSRLPMGELTIAQRREYFGGTHPGSYRTGRPFDDRKHHLLDVWVLIVLLIIGGFIYARFARMKIHLPVFFTWLPLAALADWLVARTLRGLLFHAQISGFDFKSTRRWVWWASWRPA